MSFVFPPFGAAYSLLDHAAKHLKKLDLRVQTFGNVHCSRPFTEVDPQTGDFCMKTRVRKPPSPEIACLTYDIINEARTALDYAVYDAAALIQNIPEPSGTKFPFGDNEADARGNFGRGWKNGCPPELEDLRDLIIAEVQPYKNGRGDFLFRMNKLRNAKIHRLLVPTGVAGESMDIGNGYIDYLKGVSEWDSEKQELTIARMGPSAAQAQIHATFTIAFADGSDMPGSHVFKVCAAAIGRAREAVSDIQQKASEIIRA